MRISPLLKSLILSALSLGIATAAPSRPSPETPSRAAPDVHVEGDEANSLTVADQAVVRLVHFDLCWPATNEEYEALGKSAILMLTASSIFPSDLPLTSVYVQSEDVPVALQRIAVFNAQQAKATASSKRSHTSQVSFYLLPIHLTKKDARLLVDFTGQRKAFGVTSFSKQQGLDPRLPAFLRLDEHDSPGQPDMRSVRLLLAREYPDYFPNESDKPDSRDPPPKAAQTD